MALTPSTMLPLGTRAFDFNLPDVVTGKTVSPASFPDKKALLIMFICRHCPYVVHLEQALSRLSEEYENSELGIIAISSNDAEKYPDDAPDRLREMAERLNFRFPFCFDSDQSVAKTYRAACTPDFFLFDSERCLVYRGQYDDSRPGNGKAVTGRDLKAAIKSVLSGEPVSQEQIPSMGCNIKWKAGHEPDYFSH